MTAAGIHAVVRDFWSLAKPRVVALIAFTAAVGAGLAALSHPADPLRVLAALAGITLVASSGAVFNCLAEIYIDAAAADEAAAGAPVAFGAGGSPRRGVFCGAAGGVGDVAGGAVWRKFGGGVNGGGVFWLCGGLYVGVKKGDAAKHCHRRCGGRDAAGFGMGFGVGRADFRAVAVIFDYFCLDSAAFLGAGALPFRRIRRRRIADAAGNARQKIHRHADCFIRGDVVLRFVAAVCVGDVGGGIFGGGVFFGRAFFLVVFAGAENFVGRGRAAFVFVFGRLFGVVVRRAVCGRAIKNRRIIFSVL